MKLSWQHLKITLLITSLLASAVFSVLAIVKPSFFVDEVKTPSAPKSYGSFTLEDLKRQVPQTKDGYFKFEIIELTFTSEDIEVQKVLAGQMIETTGRIMIEPSKDAKQPLIQVYQIGPGARLLTPRRYSVPLDFETQPPSLKENNWVRVVGKPEYRTENETTSLHLKVVEMNAINEPPVNQSLY